MINHIACFFRMPFSYQRVFIGYIVRKIAAMDMNGTYGEWIKLLFTAGAKAGIRSMKQDDGGLVLTLQTGLVLYVRKYPSSDMKVFHQVWGEQEYDAVVRVALEKFAVTDRIRIVDAGANVGYTSLFFKSTFPNAHIIALEPADINHRQIMQHIQLNKLHDIVVCREALWKSPAKLAFRQDLKTGEEWAFSVEERVDGDVTGVSLNALMERMQWDRIDILKMDIEGAEQYLFESPGSYTWLSSVQFIAIEIHPVPGLEERIFKALKAYGFSFFRHGELVIASAHNMKH